jgi:dolichyl-phosphate-mannose-protein mannosyltransferase
MAKKKRPAAKTPDVKRPIAPWLEPLLIGCVLFAIFYPRIQNTAFHGDESWWIASSHHLEAFVGGRIDSPVWNESYDTLTQPPLSRYVIGIGRWFGGYGPRDLNRKWNFRLSDEENIARGNMPNSDLLWWSRLPMCILTIVCVLLAFNFVSRSAGRLAGYIMLTLFVFSTYFSTTLFRAMGEAPLLTATMLAALAGSQAAASWKLAVTHKHRVSKRFLHPLIWFGIMGALCGLAGAAKLNGLSIILAGLVLSLLMLSPKASNVSRSELLRTIAFAWASLILASVFTFVALNPYLYPNPIGRTGKMVTQRLNDMERQQVNNAAAQISGPLITRLLFIGERVFYQCAALRFPGSLIINLLLCSVGLWFLLFAAWTWLRSGAGYGGSLVLILIAFSASAPALMTPLDWDRYYLFPVFFSTVFIAVGCSRIIQGLFEWTRRWRGSTEETVN